MYSATKKGYITREIDYKFQSTHPCRVRRRAAGTVSAIFENFNPRTHVECDGNKDTRPFQIYDFNPRTHVECDLPSDIEMIENNDFNPRTHVECDTEPHSRA